jgi:hypothetical protein
VPSVDVVEEAQKSRLPLSIEPCSRPSVHPQRPPSPSSKKTTPNSRLLYKPPELPADAGARAAVTETSPEDKILRHGRRSRLADHTQETLPRQATGPARSTRLQALRRRSEEHRRGGERAAATLFPLDAASTTTTAPLGRLVLLLSTGLKRSRGAPPSSRRRSGGRMRGEPPGSPAVDGGKSVASLFAFLEKQRRGTIRQGTNPQ